MSNPKNEEAEILALIEELTVSELCLASEMRQMGEILLSLPQVKVETSDEDFEAAH